MSRNEQRISTSQRPTMPPSAVEVADLEHYCREFARDENGFVKWLMVADDADVARRVVGVE